MSFQNVCRVYIAQSILVNVEMGLAINVFTCSFVMQISVYSNSRRTFRFWTWDLLHRHRQCSSVLLQKEAWICQWVGLRWQWCGTFGPDTNHRAALRRVRVARCLADPLCHTGQFPGVWRPLSTVRTRATDACGVQNIQEL